MCLKMFGRKIRKFNYFRNLKYKYLLYFIYVILIIIASIVLIYEAPIKPLRIIKIKIINKIQCYSNTLNLPTLPEISDDEPPKGKSIFFHETSCKSAENNRITITTRQACAIESAAILNPNYSIYVLYTSPGALKLQINNKNDKILQQLMSYKNVKFKYLNFNKYLKGTPVEELHNNLLIESSNFAISHASDVLRYLTLWRYGGIYLDLDVVLLKSLENVKPNFAGRESDHAVAAGVLSFSHDGPGHKWARQTLEDLKENFNGNQWGDNGPGVITRLLEKICNKTEVKYMTRKKCQGFMVYPPEVFYPIRWRNWNEYFDSNRSNDIMNSFNNSIAVHVWNRFSVNKIIKLNSNSTKVPYEIIARKYCPKVIAASGTEF